MIKTSIKKLQKKNNMQIGNSGIFCLYVNLNPLLSQRKIFVIKISSCQLVWDFLQKFCKMRSILHLFGRFDASKHLIKIKNAAKRNNVTVDILCFSMNLKLLISFVCIMRK